MTLYVKQVAGNGNCLLNAVSCQIHSDASELRLALYEEYRKNWEKYMDFLENPLQYAEQIKEEGEWLDETDLAALAHVVDRAIELYVDTLYNLEEPYMTYPPRLKAVDKPVRVIFVHGNHYDAVLDSPPPPPRNYCSTLTCIEDDAEDCSVCGDCYCKDCMDEHECVSNSESEPAACWRCERTDSIQLSGLCSLCQMLKEGTDQCGFCKRICVCSCEDCGKHVCVLHKSFHPCVE